MYSFYCHQNNGEKMGPSSILSISDTVTIGPMVNFNGSSNAHELKTLRLNRPLDFTRCASIGPLRKLVSDANTQCVHPMVISTS